MKECFKFASFKEMKELPFRSIDDCHLMSQEELMDLFFDAAELLKVSKTSLTLIGDCDSVIFPMEGARNSPYPIVQMSKDSVFRDLQQEVWGNYPSGIQ